ncbi:MAG: tetratricopeptide repeat protein [Gemmatimonadetes bacterium]|nr:tetratricopeptide repeat protein [Gemmatimonadota bacterium]
MSSFDYVARQILTRGVSAFERDDYGSALADFRTLLETYPDFADVRNKAGLCLALLGSSEAALEEFDHAVRVNPGYVEAHLNRAIVLNDLGQFPEAREAVTRAAELEGRQGDARFRGDVGNRIATTHARLGDLYAATGAPELAIGQYREALLLRPRFVDIRMKLAKVLVETGQLLQARSEVESILEERPSYTGARILYGTVCHRLGDTDTAVEQWERAANEAPADLRPRAYLATMRRESAV